MQGKYDKAIEDFERELELSDDEFRPAVQRDIAWLLATCPDAKFRDGRRSLELARKLHEATEDDDDPNACEALAAAHAECGDFVEAVKWQTKALELTPSDDEESREEMQARLELFKAGKPYRETPRLRRRRSRRKLQRRERQKLSSWPLATHRGSPHRTCPPPVRA